MGGDKWAFAVENAVGRLFNAFIVNDHKDNLVLRACAREANYNRLQIIIYDFSRPRYSLTENICLISLHLLMGDYVNSVLSLI